MSINIPVNEPLIDGNEKKYLLECIDSGWISSEGPFVEEFERKFAERVGRKYAVAVSNGTAAIDLAVEALCIGDGDEVILPAFTIISCVLQIVRSGAIPVLVDSDPCTWNMNVSQIEAKITAKTKAIMIVHIYGLPVNMDPVIELARRYGLRIIEDAAEMHGQTYLGAPCGSFGDISTFSFYPNKHITTGEGGMVVTNDLALADACRSLRNLCFQPSKRFVHERLGWNMRMTNLQAAIGLAQLERLDEFVDRKRRMGCLYTRLLEGIKGFDLPLSKTDYAENIYWVYGLNINGDQEINAKEAMNRLAKRGIGTRPFFYPMHEQPILREMGFFKGERYPEAEKLSRKGFYIPSGMALTQDQIKHVAHEIREEFS
ncbi:DegT/DnrJ/EryC1/StrS family aminotransferase [Polynucleobacter brandtiae]|nr:DegT/DnrJ/EryC1/StrS family aminotransferase [Polynucleobacter brandtiae]